jgi:predicted DNA binding CopG/RHH family protein
LKDEAVDVTLTLSKSSLDFFKNEARKRNVAYRQMIRKLLDEYATRHS